MFSLTNILDNLLSGGIAGGMTWFATRAYYKSHERLRARGWRALMHGVADPLIVAVPERPPQQWLILPWLSMEDVFAYQALQRALAINGGGATVPKLRGANYLRDTEKGKNEIRTSNLVLICSSKTNPLTAQALSMLGDRFRNEGRSDIYVPKFVEQSTTGRWVIALGDAGSFPSPSYDEESQTTQPPQDPSGTLHDVAIIVKAPNPWARDGKHKCLILAGIRGLGTWGAAVCLRHKWKELLARKGKGTGMSKQGDFAAIIKVCYEGGDIDKDKMPIVHFDDWDRRRAISV